MTLIASRLKKIKPSPTLVVTNKAIEMKASGLNVISLSAGEPDFDTPNYIKEGAYEAIKRGETKYTLVDGTIELKKAIQEKFARENNLNYQLNQITVGTGAKQTLFNALYVTINPGDEVIIPAPYWVSYIDIVAIADGISVIVKTKEENGFKLQASELENSITPNTKWVILNSPNNPTGSIYTEHELKELAQVLLRHPHVMILTDDIYEHIRYEGHKFFTIAQVEPKLFDRTFTINGVSKAYSMTGWRLGYGAGPTNIIKAISIIQSQSTSNPCSISQAAAAVALKGNQDFLIKNNILFKERRDLVVKSINSIEGLSCPKPDGAFYVFVNCSQLLGKETPKNVKITNSNQLCQYLLEEALVAVVSGDAFGMEGYFRVSYATSKEILEEAVLRIARACNNLS